MDKINKTIQSFTDEEVKITYVLSLMVKDNLITVEDKNEIKKGLRTPQSKFKKLGTGIRDMTDYSTISHTLLVFLKDASKQFGDNDPVEAPELPQDISPETIDIMHASEDSSPSDNALFHRKVKYGNYDNKDDYSLNLKNWDETFWG